MKNDKIDVSVAIMTYYHEKTIAQAIDSVLSQKTKYKYEIVISDDCSGDKTRSIIDTYQKKYPHIIRAFYNKENKGIAENNYYSRCQCRGRYIATLSGDDYWIDNNKIQKQVSFLDSHPKCPATVTNVEGRFDESIKSFCVYPKKKYRGTYITLKQYLHGVMFGTHGMMMKNFYLSPKGRGYFSIMTRASKYIDDATECILILLKGPVYAMNINGVAYRVNKNKQGKNNYNSQNTAIIGFKKIIDLYNYLDEEIVPKLDLFYLYQYNVAIGLAGALLGNRLNDFNEIYSTIPNKYRNRGLLIRSAPKMISFVNESLLRKIKSLIM